MEQKDIHTLSNRTGTTIVELILFVGITAMITGAILSFSLLTNQVGMRSEVMADVEHAGTFASDYISQKVRAADSVSATTNTLTTTVGGESTEITLENGKIKETDSLGNVSFITTENTNVRSLKFIQLTATESAKDGISISFDIENRNPGGVLKLPVHDLSFHMTVAGR